MIQPYPLDWPPNKPRCELRQPSRFRCSFVTARDELIAELEKMKAAKVIVSSNVPVRKDGLPYARHSAPDDPGVAVYFTVRKTSYALACDRWELVRANLRAIGQHIAALRGIERWGVTSIEEVFSPFALPEKLSWWSILGVDQSATLGEIKRAYHRLSLEFHPDAGGDRDKFERVKQAYDEAKARAHE